MQVLDWWCKQPQYATTDAVTGMYAPNLEPQAQGGPALARADARAKDIEGTLAQRREGTLAQRRLATTRAMQLRLKTFCDVTVHQAAEACEVMAAQALCTREPAVCKPGTAPGHDRVLPNIDRSQGLGVRKNESELYSTTLPY